MENVNNKPFTLVLTGHSLRAALCYLFLLDVLSSWRYGHSPLDSLSSNSSTGSPLPPDAPITLVTFGCPRSGKKALADYFRNFTNEHRATRGEASLQDFAVIAHKDGTFIQRTRACILTRPYKLQS